jgi:hypothetical protein
MSSRREKWAQFEIKENDAVKTFLIAIIRQKDALQKGELTRRSWVKPEGAGFVVQIGKLKRSYKVAKTDDVHALLDDFAADARDDEELIAEIEAAYGTPLGEEPAIKKPRKARTPKAAAVDTDVLSIPLRPRT